MKKILITGSGSYIGTSFENWVNQWPDQYKVETIDMRGNDWKEISFNSYDVIYHIAAIVHVKENDTEKYFRVNRDLAVDVANKAKEETVKQFIFLSTMGVYGKETGYINEMTIPNPKTPYAKSKQEAEEFLRGLRDDSFKVAILRPPIVYGKNCRGNYPRLVSMALKLPIFPNVKNERSMIYIDNLSEFVRLTIDKELGGLFFPQNKEYLNTVRIIQKIRTLKNKRTVCLFILTILIKLLCPFSKQIQKVFGNLVYDKTMPGGPCTDLEYQVVNFEDSINNSMTI